MGCEMMVRHLRNGVKCTGARPAVHLHDGERRMVPGT